jgi:hypothetical protein
MATNRNRAFCTTNTLKEEASMEWTIEHFATWAMSKDIGSCHFSSNFSFQFDKIKKNYNFNIGISPRGSKEKNKCEDNVGLFLISNNKVCKIFYIAYLTSSQLK